MAWVPWIRIEAEDSEDEAVRALYERTRNRVTGKVADTVRLTSLTPEVAGLLDSLLKAIGAAARGLSPREKEIAALIVAVNNGCVH